MIIETIEFSGSPQIPFADQYAGVWAILESYGNALVSQAKQINIQLHLEQARGAAMQSAIAAQSSTDLNITRDGIAVIELNGSLMKQASSMASSRSTVAARRQVRAAANSPDVSGILLHIDSPGGMVAGTVDLADDINSAKGKKPVYSYIEDLGASAAYWIASQADQVFANRSAEVGSIGVYMAVGDWSKFYNDAGVKVHVVRFGEMKGAGMQGTEITDAQIAEWQKSVDEYGRMFIEAIAAGRKMTRAQATQLADGRIHGAAQAVDLKLIDGIQTLDATMAALVRAGNASKSRSKSAMKTDDDTTAAAKPATSIELKKAFPKSTAEWREEQIEADATMEEATMAWNAELQEQLDASEKARAEAEKKVADAEAAAAKAAGKQAAATTGKAPLVRGNKAAAASAATGEESAEGVDYFQLAREYQEQKKCTWRDACQAIKRQHPEAREAFKGKPLPL